MVGEALVSRGVSLEVITDMLTIVFIYVCISGCVGSSCPMWAFSRVAILRSGVQASHCGG